MKVTPALKEELANWLDTYWTTYLKGDIKTWATFIRDDYRNIGGTKEEIWNSKQEIIDYTNSIMDQMLGTVDIRNRKVELIPYGEYMMVHEFTDLFVKIEGEWTFYGPFRMSTLLEKTKTGWIALHQHGSYPDMKAMEGEAFSIDALKAENAKLQAAVKSRTLELEQNNRELEIEAATERVRVQSMAMHHPDDLDKVNKEILNQLKWLQIEGLSGVTFYLVDEDGWVKAWDFSSPGNIGKQTSYTLQFDSNKYEMLGYPFKILRQTDLDYFVADYPLEKLEKAVYEFEEIDSTIATVIKEALATGALIHQWSACVRMSNGLLGIDLVKPPNEDTKSIVLKIAGAFNQAYTRFLDLQKAEAQAREAQIETCLERVRSRSLAMHNTSELQEVIHTVHKELLHLNIAISGGSFIVINKDIETSLRCWGSGGTADTSEEVILPLYKKPFCTNLIDRIKKDPGFFTEEFTQVEKIAFFTFLFKHEPWSKLDVKQQHETLSSPGGYTRSCAVSKHTSIFIINHFGKIFSDDENDILKRFANVFEQTYTRFLDLQKAEAQAREAQIEAALEKARSRSMGMQSSVELPEVANVLFLEVQALGIPAWSCGYNIITEDKTVATCWMSSEGTLQLPFKLRLFGEASFAEMGDFILSEQTMLVQELGDKALEEHYAYMKSFPDLKPTFDQLDELGLSLPTYQINHLCKFTQGFLLFITYEKVPASHDVFKRFTKVFEQTYTRFLDLQKAEAQTREAQIELGLERVRARAMAMQKSDELSELVDTVFKELTKLDFALNWCIINIIDESSLSNTVWAAIPDIDKAPESYYMKFEDYPYHNAILKDWKERKTKSEYTLEEDEKRIYDEYLFSETEFKRTPKAAQDASRAMKKYVCSFSFSNFGGLQTVGDSPLSDANLDILSRFGKVFDLTYTRFNDLQKAEAQAREAEIQLALERVRARSLAMHHTSELQEIVKVVAQQLQHMGLNINGGVFITINEELDQDIQLWASLGAADYVQKVFVPLFDRPIFTQLRDAIKKGNNFFDETYSKQEKDEMFNHLFHFSPWNDLSKERRDELLSREGGLTRTAAISQNTSIVITNHNGNKFSDQEIDILKRFGSVFEQTYTRFLDLQKAETQAREAKIEAALERTRTQSMIMQHSNELDDTLHVFHQQVLLLGIPSAFSFLWLPDEEKDQHKFWAAWAINNSTDFSSKAINYPLDRNEPATAQCLIDWKSNEPVYSYHVPAAGVENYFAVWSELIEGVEQLKPEYFSEGLYFVEGFMKYGCFGVMVATDLREDEKKLLSRFATEFERTYTRFLDLKKAEAQTREAKINLAVERVRARALAMFKSEEILELVFKLKQEMMDLEIPNVVAATIHLKEKEGDYTMWDLTALDFTEGKFHQPMVVNYRLEEVDPNLFIKRMWENTAPYLLVVQDEEDLKRTLKFLRDHGRTKEADESEDFIKTAGIKYAYHPTILLNNGRMCIDLLQPPSNEIEMILTKMGAAFDLAYKRFEDLKNSEAQLREAQIEAALERVRSRTMAMQHSNELLDVASILFQQVKALGVPQWNCGFNIWNIGDDEFTYYPGSPDGIISPSPCKIPLTEHPVFMRFDESRKRGDDLFVYEKEGEEQADHYQYMISLPGVGDLLKSMLDSGFELPKFQIDHLANFAYGNLIFITYEHFPEMHEVFKRFAKVFEQTYTRFLDLQKSEFQTHQAKIETALEKVRARALAMQQPEELAEVAQVMRYEMGLLGVEELETSSIYIHEEVSENAECWYAIKDSKVPEKQLVSDHFKLQLNDTWVGQQMHAFYHSNKKQISIPMKDANRKEWIDYCSKQSKLLDGFYGEVIPNRTYHLYKFSNGTIGAATPSDISAESWDLLQRAASVLSLAYSRFKDLTQAKIDLLKLKEEKQKAEDALTELQATQKQLIQSEKMASLGELTAGIAHEIQNPLNFVNNFSEVSSELVDEMNEEIDKGNLTDAKEIANDLKQNLEKINHHGKRAGDIVKGMLQHSRSRSGVKEPTDINALADEYLRLAYHGLRAKDKIFNATMKTEYDESIGKINIIPQDIGRVILNLITNAFYVVNEKKKSGIENYEPTVWVTTKLITLPLEPVPTGREGQGVLISVKDNGNGIPPKILDKIFQPFFTTKPTGQGTGLGLSLSYDIVKAHGGELKVETKEARPDDPVGRGEGSTFIIQLPTN